MELRQELELIAPKARCFKDCRTSILAKVARELPKMGYERVTRCRNCELWEPNDSKNSEAGGYCKRNGREAQRPDFYCGEAIPIVKPEQEEANYRLYLESGTEDYMSYFEWLTASKENKGEPIW